MCGCEAAAQTAQVEQEIKKQINGSSDVRTSSRTRTQRPTTTRSGFTKFARYRQ